VSYATWDIETTTRTHMKRKASPFFKENWVVTHAFKKKGDRDVKEYRFGRTRPVDGWLRPVIDGVRLLCGFNIKFDVLHAIQSPDNLSAWMEWVAGGGNVWDCQLAEYLLNGMGQQEQMLALDEVAPRYGGNVKVDEVKALWAAGVQTEDIDPELLSRYLCGGQDEYGQWQEGDIGNTEKIALGQIARAREAGQLNSILLNMGSLLFTIEAERNGMFVETMTAFDMARELKKEVDELKVALDAYLPADLPFEFKWSSRFHKSALIFGGTVMWDGHEYDLKDGTTVYAHEWEGETKQPRLYSQKDEVHAYLAKDEPGLGYAGSQGGLKAGDLIPLDQAKLWNVPVVRVASGKNAGEVKTKKVKVNNYDKPKGRAVKVPYTFPRMTQPKKAWESADPGVYSVAEEVIEELGNRGIPFLKALSQLQSTAKNLGTYFIVYDAEGNAKGMLALVDSHGIIHHKINHTSTVTGRFSASDPNLQNIPKGNKSKIKMVFVSRFGHYVVDDFGNMVWVPEGKIIQSDFSALEIYVQAILTKCRQLIEDLKAGLDMHCLRLANTEGLPYEDVLLLCKGDDAKGIEPVKEWDYKRTDSKVYSFQAAYGAGDAKISDSTGMPKERVAALRAADDARYPEINDYFARRTEEIKRNRKPSGIVVPHPEATNQYGSPIMCHLGKSSVRTPDGKLYSYMESPSPEFLAKKGIAASFSPTEIKNYEVQGEGAEWAKAAMWLAVREFYRRKNWGGLALLVNQVHDAVYSDAHNTVAYEAAVVLHACMEAASEYMEFLFNWKVPVPVPSDTTWGTSMMDEKKIPDIKSAAQVVRQDIRSRYMGGYTPSFIH
jgi:DNA polymerase-1